MYILQASARRTYANGESSNAAGQKDNQMSDIQLWHGRMGHLGQKGMEILLKKGCLGELKKTKMSFCEDCVIGKTHKVSFGPALHVTKAKLDYIHSDLWGSPNVPPILSRSQYFLTFTDDFSRKVWIYFLRHKNEAFECFVSWKKMVETQSERKIKKLLTYNGLELCNLQFNSFCKEEGMIRHRTCTYTSQQNGVAERLNRKIMNKVRSMLSESGFEVRFWAEAATTTVYLINRSMSSAIQMEIPEERWTLVLPSFKDLRRFGCLVFVHTSDGKLNPRTRKGYFTDIHKVLRALKSGCQRRRRLLYLEMLSLERRWCIRIVKLRRHHLKTLLDQKL